MRRRILFAATVLATALTAPVVPIAVAPARADAVPCPVAVPAGTTCGLLEVPERRDVPGGRTIKVAYAVHRSTAGDRKADPIVYSSGGPGSSSLQLTGLLSAAPFGRDRDVVVLEQRGSRWSQPHLSCPEIDRALLDSLSRPGRDEQERRSLTDAGRACRTRLDAAGVDLRGYTTAEIAADVPALRAALHYPSWNLFGVSYSTRSMIAAAAADPAGTRAVVLDSFLPAGTAQYDAAPADLLRTLEKVRPGLSAQLLRVVARLDARPAAVEVADPFTHRPRVLHLTGDDVASLIGEGMQDADLVTAVPPLLQALDDGRDGPLQAIGQIAAESLVSHDTGVYYAVNCQDEVPFNTLRGTGAPRSFFADADPAVCAGLALPAGSDTAATTPAPVLVLGGSFDAATPVDTARAEAVRALPRATTVEFSGVAHAVFLTSRCGRETIAAFVAAPAGFDRPCDPASSPYRTLGPGDRYVTTRPYAVATAPWPALLAPGALAAACLGVLVWGLVGRRPALVAAGLAGPLLLGVAGWLLHGVVQSNPASLIVGVPWPVAWCAALAGAVPALVIAVAAALRRAPAAAVLLLLAAGAVQVAWWVTG